MTEIKEKQNTLLCHLNFAIWREIFICLNIMDPLNIPSFLHFFWVILRGWHLLGTNLFCFEVLYFMILLSSLDYCHLWYTGSMFFKFLHVKKPLIFAHIWMIIWVETSRLYNFSQNLFEHTYENSGLLVPLLLQWSCPPHRANHSLLWPWFRHRHYEPFPVIISDIPLSHCHHLSS